MKNKILCFVVIILCTVLIIEVSFHKKTNFSFESKEISEINEEKLQNKIKLFDQETNQISELNLEDYIIGVVAAEMPASFEIEALKAQAVAARTFAIYKQLHRQNDYDVIKGISDQAYNTLEEMQKKWQADYEKNLNKITNAVMETKEEILTYQNQVIESFYFAMSNGYTEKCELVFQEELPYITMVESAWDNEKIKNYEVTKIIEKKEFCESLNIDCQNISITDIERTDSKRVYSLKINGQSFKGTEIRKMLGLRSTDFDIDIQDKVIIKTRGSGHGVGMSQYGADGMAKDGYNYQEILKYFYQNVEISKI